METDKTNTQVSFTRTLFCTLNSVFVIYSSGWKGLKLEKFGQSFQLWSIHKLKNPKILIWIAPDKIHLIFSIAF